MWTRCETFGDDSPGRASDGVLCAAFRLAYGSADCSIVDDANLWYKIAEVNGLTAESTLVEGQPLIIPVGVQSNSNNSATFKPYDPLEILGNVSPTTAPPPKKGKNCGGMGQVLLAVIAVVVVALVAPHAIAAVSNLTGGTAVQAGAVAKAIAGGVAVSSAGATTAGAIVGGAIAGAAGSIVSQGIGVATEDKFSRNAVGLAAIGGGAGGAVNIGGAAQS
jgi:hypothetical protein